jgi:hypothetical protein
VIVAVIVAVMVAVMVQAANRGDQPPGLFTARNRPG